MYHHQLVFTDDDRAKLKKRYHALMQKLEMGKMIEKHSIGDLTEAMRVILQSQKGLQPFWQQVQQDPAKHYQLHLTYADKELLNLPWHLAIDTKQYPFIHISKGATSVKSLSPYLPQPGPLRILVMVSSPEDLNYNKRLSYEEEEQIILKALSPLWSTAQVQIHFTEDGSLASLHQKLQQQHYHILYFSGHSIYRNDTGYLLLEDTLTFKRQEVKAEELAGILEKAKSNTPPLIILSACQTAQGNTEAGFRGVADELVHKGVPAVIAMAFSIKDQFNIVFAGHLYEHLANKRPLPVAYSSALQDMRMQEQQQLEQANQKQYYPSQWLIPQLYISKQVNHIVDWQAQEQTGAVTDTRFIEGGSGFIGRRRECALLLNELVKNQPVLITGQGGIGKTALAEYLVKRLMMQDTEYYCFAFNETTIGLEAMASQLLHYLKTADPDHSPSYEGDQWKNNSHHLEFLIKQVTRFCKPVWVFDNMEACQLQTGGLLKTVFSEWVKFLRAHLWYKQPVILVGRYDVQELNDACTIGLNQVPFVDFYRKCSQLSIRTLHTKIGVADMAAVASMLYELFGGSYRTLHMLNELYVSDADKTQALLQQIVKRKDVRKARELMEGIHEKLESSNLLVLEELVTLLTTEEQKTLHLLLYFDRPVLPLALEMQRPGKIFTADLQRLKNITLIEEHAHKETGHKLYYIAPLVKNSVEGIDLPQVYFYPEYAGDYYYKAGDQIFFSYDDLEAAVKYYQQSRNIVRLNEVGVLLTNKYQRAGLHDATLHYGELIEKMVGDETDGDILNNIGLTYLNFGNTKEALKYFTRFSIFARKKGKNEMLSMALNAIGQTYSKQGNYDQALEWLQKSLIVSKAGKYKEKQAVTLSNMAFIYCELEDYGKAIKAYQKCLEIRKKANNQFGVANTLNNIARICEKIGEYEMEMELTREALSIAVEMGNKHLQGYFLNNIGLRLMQKGDYSAALVCLQKNLATSESIDDEEEIGKAMYCLGLTYKHLGQHNEAINYISKGALILQKYDYKDKQAESQLQMGVVYIDRGDMLESLPLLEMSLTGYRSTKQGISKGAAQALYYMGYAYLYLNEIDKSIQHLGECLAILEKVDDKETESFALNALSKAYAEKDEIDKVLECHEKNLAIRQSLGDRTGEALVLSCLATAYNELGLPEMYFYYERQAYAIHAETNNLAGLYLLSSMLGAFLCNNLKQKYLQEGIWLLEQAYEIGLLSDEFPGLHTIESMIERFRPQPVKKKKTAGRKTTPGKKKSSPKI